MGLRLYFCCQMWGMRTTEMASILPNVGKEYFYRGIDPSNRGTSIRPRLQRCRQKWETVKGEMTKQTIVGDVVTTARCISEGPNALEDCSFLNRGRYRMELRMY